MFPRSLRISAAILAFFVLVGAVLVLVPLYRSLPDRTGRFTFPGLAGVAAIQRDDQGVVRISAMNRRDAAKLLGFAHAQDRFFQMDLLRRTAAGELAELLGPAALPSDRAHRRFRLREVARAAVEKLPEPQRELVEDYALGVTAGLYELDAAPFEYLLLRTKPAKWRAEDSLLTMAAMALILQHPDGEPELSRAVVRDTFSPAAVNFLLSLADDFEAPLDDSRITPPLLPANPGPPLSVPPSAPATPQPNVPLEPTSGADSRDTFGSRIYTAWARQIQGTCDEIPGSNAFAVRGLRGETPVTLLANDLHLSLGVPNTWYRAQIAWRTSPRHVRTLDGITLPGLPVLVAGSNGGAAWGFTNAQIDTTDLVVLELDPANPRRYRTPEGWRDLEQCSETLAVNGGPAETYTFDTTRWGPVLGPDHRGRLLALHWAMAEPAAYDLQLSALENVNSARAVLAFAKSSGMPQLNILAVDRDGNMGWTVAGHLPRRVGLDGTVPASWANGDVGWEGWQPLDRHPQVVNPRTGRLWSANNRMVGGAELAVLGEGDYVPATRARQIRDRLAALKELSPQALLDIQLDVRGLYLERWQALLLATLDDEARAQNPGRAQLRALVENWGGQAVPSSAGYRLVHDFRSAMMRAVDSLVFAPCRQHSPTFTAASLPLDRIAFVLASERPAGWHPAGQAGWRQLALDAADAVVAGAGGAEGLAAHTWGEANRLQMRHPLSGAFPWLGRFLDMPSVPLPGDPQVVRAQSPTFGASVRFVIQPGWEAGSLLHLPGGQCANPLSPYYSDGHDAWAEAVAAPLQPGRTDKHLVMAPEETD